MFRLLKCKVKDIKEETLEEDVEYDQCPMSDVLQQQLRDFCLLLVEKIGCVQPEKEAETQLSNLLHGEEPNSWVDSLAQLVVKVPPAPLIADDSAAHRGSENFRLMIISMLRKWAAAELIESHELIREMFQLLLRQYTGVAELMNAMKQTYVLHERNMADIEDFVVYLIQIRALLTVQFESGEEAILKRGLWSVSQ